MPKKDEPEGIIERTQCLNFVLVGEVRAGTYPLHTALDSVPTIVSHAHLLHDDVKLRNKSYTSYFKHFGAPFDPNESSAHYFLQHRIFDRPVHDETIIGVRLTYDQIRKYDLFDLFKEKTNEGDFCVIHLERNPLVCFVSNKQAEKSKLFYQTNKTSNQNIPDKVWIDVEELAEFVSNHIMIRNKINMLCHDVCRIQYHDMYFDFETVMTTILSFLETAEIKTYRPTVKRLANRTIDERAFQLDKVLAELPSDLRSEIMSRDLF